MAAVQKSSAEQSPAPPRLGDRLLHWIKRLPPQTRLMALSMVVGVIAGLGAILFYLAGEVVFRFALTDLGGYSPLQAGGESSLFPPSLTPLRPWLLVVIAGVGGLLCGWIVYTFAPEAEGHGTDAVIRAFHHRDGVIRPRVPIVKLIASAITLGTGGSGGREGPIAQIGAGFGSFLGGALGLSARERRLLMAAGMGAGIAAIFRAPLAGTLFAAEVLYSQSDLESDVLIPAGLGSVTAYCTFATALGWQPLFDIPPDIAKLLVFENALELIAYLLLAMVMVALAAVYVRSFYGLTRAFHRLPIKPHFRPMIGATLTAILAVGAYYALARHGQGDQRALTILSFGYGIIQEALLMSPVDEPSWHFGVVLLVVSIGKLLGTGLTIGSGGSAGVFGASMVIGGCCGGALGLALDHIAPGIAPHPACFVMVGMAGFFAAAAKTPFSTIVMVSEMTGNYNLLLPTLWVCSLSFLLSEPHSIYSEQAPNLALSPVHRH
jgi:CIC family chloride channel protein